jgi:hypothetical protein
VKEVFTVIALPVENPRASLGVNLRDGAATLHDEVSAGLARVYDVVVSLPHTSESVAEPFNLCHLGSSLADPTYARRRNGEVNLDHGNLDRAYPLGYCDPDLVEHHIFPPNY